jgi:TonB family protein
MNRQVIGCLGLLLMANAAAACPPPAETLRAIRESQQVRLFRLGSRAERQPNPLDESAARFLGFEVRESSVFSAEGTRAMSRAFGSSAFYACDGEPAQPDAELFPVQVGIEFLSKGGRVRMVVFQPEQRVEMEFGNGAGAELGLSVDGANHWWDAMRAMLRPGTRPHDFYTYMRAEGDSTLWVPDTLEVELDAITRVPPDYPDLARSAGVSGIVRVRALVGPDGLVRRAQVIMGVEMLNEAALRAVRQWQFKPASRAGKPAWAWTTVPVRFSLN